MNNGYHTIHHFKPLQPYHPRGVGRGDPPLQIPA
jgi:hypothetical protein